MRAYADAQAGDRKAQVELVDALALVDLVESGAFLSDLERTQVEVDTFLDRLDRSRKDIAAYTLSTHLPWLRGFIERARPGRELFDPLENAISAIIPFAVSGSGQVLALVTED